MNLSNIYRLSTLTNKVFNARRICNSTKHIYNLPKQHNQQLKTLSKTLYLSNDKKSCNTKNEKRYVFTKSILSSTPSRFRPYLNLIRFDKPVGSYLLYAPCTWSIALAANPLPDVKIMTLFGIGSVIMRSAGCVINDMWDSEYDKKVTRTLTRPIAANEITHKQALGFLAGLLSCGLMVLLSLNWYSVFLGAASMGLVVTYPLMKRFTYWPQLMLGLTLNWGALLGYSAVVGWCDWSICLPLYLSAMSWTMIYDTIYAHQDKRDDVSIGVKSTALLFGDNTKIWLSGFALTMISGLAVTGLYAEQTWPFYLSVLTTASHLSWQIKTLDINNSDSCASKFRSNQWIGLLLFFGIVFGNSLKPSDKVSLENLASNDT